MTLNPDQQAAFDAFCDFADGNGTLFALTGYAGTGKSYTSAQLLDVMQSHMGSFDEFLWLAPTWKAVRVSGGFLKSAAPGLDFEVGYDRFFHEPGRMITTTTQQALGIRPIVSDDQTVDKMEFRRQGQAIVQKLKPRFIVIDEVSMLSQDHLTDLHMIAKQVGTKIVIIGDPGQLPPVKAPEIAWDKITNRHELRQIMRQAGDSAIPHVGEAIRSKRDWRAVQGAGVNSCRSVFNEFLNVIDVPAVDEGERDVFVAYRNAVVDRVQEAACQKVYGHDAKTFEAGQIVIAQNALMARGGKMAVANQDQIVVREVGGQGAWGREVIVELQNGRQVRVEYLSGADLADMSHPYNVEVKRRGAEAGQLQKEWMKAGKPRGLKDQERKEAWDSYFGLKDRTILSFAHPFAITSHKSQGSTYRNAYIAADDIERFDARGLYVAATRPKHELFY